MTIRDPERRDVLVPLALALLAAGCGASGDPDTGEPEVTFHRDVEPILQAHCQECHHDGGIAPFALTEYEDAEAWANLIASRAESRDMPPWGAQETDEFQPRLPWRDDPRLSDEQIATLRKWADLGAPQGDPADAPPPVEFEDAAIPGATHSVSPDVGWSAPPGDDYRCFVLDPELDESLYLTGLGVVPGNSEVVHHVLVYIDQERQAEGLDAEEGSYECFGGPGVDAWLAAGWAPGMDPLELPEGAGMEVPAGSLLVMQVHYHAEGNEPAAEDRTTLQLRMTDEAPEWFAGVYLEGNYSRQYFDHSYLADGDGLQPGPNDRTDEPEFRIPAGVADHVESQRTTLTNLYGLDRIKLLGVAAHMHYLGRDMLIQVRHAQPKEGEPELEGLLQVPDWDFHWQRTYYWDAAIEDLPELREGDQILTRCTYDNTLDNPFVADALEERGLDAPVDVYLGEGTLDEMCLAALVIAYRVD